MKFNNSNQGSILIGVLWSLFFLAALALVINASIIPQLNLAQRLRDRVTTRYFAEAGLKRAIIELRADETEGYDTLNELWCNNEEAFKDIELSDNAFFSLEYVKVDENEESKTLYGLIDEERKININFAPVEVLISLFEIVGQTTTQVATDISDSIIDWRDSDDEPLDNGAENSYYQSLDPGYLCKNANFEILEELLFVKEMTQELYDKVKDYITVYGDGSVNINTADIIVLRSLGMRTTLAENVITFRNGDDGKEATEDDNIFNSTEDAALLLSSKVSLNAEEINEFTTIMEGELVKVQSDYFRGHTRGGLKDREAISEINFVISRDENIRLWQEI